MVEAAAGVERILIFFVLVRELGTKQSAVELVMRKNVTWQGWHALGNWENDARVASWIQIYFGPNEV